MERETKTYRTPIGNQEVVVKAYLIGREKRAIENIYIAGNDNLTLDKEGSLSGIRVNLVDKAQDLGWRTVLVSIDGKVDGVDGFNIVEEVLNMRSSDYDFVVQMVNAIARDEEFTQKKTI